MAQQEKMSSRTPSWKQLRASQSTVDQDYYLMFPKSFYQVESALDHTAYGFYWCLRNWLFSTGGFMPFNVKCIRDYTHSPSFKYVEKLLEKVVQLDEFDVIDVSDLPVFCKQFMFQSKSFWNLNPKVLVNWEIIEALRYAEEKHSAAVKNGTKASHRKLSDLSACPQAPCSDADVDTDVDVDVKAGNVIQFSEFRDIWNRWAEFNGIERFEKLTARKRRLFETRRDHFLDKGAGTSEFWVNLLSVVSECRQGFYVGNNDGFKHDGNPWHITVEWLLKNDDNIERFLEAVE